MGAPDWDSTLQRPATAAGGVPTRDVVVGPAGMKLTLGDTTSTSSRRRDIRQARCRTCFR